MFSLVAIALLALLIVGGIAFFAARYGGRGRRGNQFANLRPPLLALVAVLVACLLGWALAIVIAAPKSAT